MIYASALFSTDKVLFWPSEPELNMLEYIFTETFTVIFEEVPMPAR